MDTIIYINENCLLKKELYLFMSSRHIRQRKKETKIFIFKLLLWPFLEQNQRIVISFIGKSSNKNIIGESKDL